MSNSADIRALTYLGGHDMLLDSLEFSLVGFQSYLVVQGVKYFTARELCTAHNQAAAVRTMQTTTFLPEKEWWPIGAALARLGDKMRECVGNPVKARNWWRPPAYNAAVGGAKQSDHLTAHAIDFDFTSRLTRRKAQKKVIEPLFLKTELKMSLGIGATFMHVGLCSPLGHRQWTYKSYQLLGPRDQDFGIG